MNLVKMQDAHYLLECYICALAPTVQCIIVQLLDLNCALLLSCLSLNYFKLANLMLINSKPSKQKATKRIQIMPSCWVGKLRYLHFLFTCTKSGMQLS